MFESYISSIRSVIIDITSTVPELSYIDPQQVAVNFKKTRGNSIEEVWAEITGIESEKKDGAKLRHGRVERFFTSTSLLLKGTPVKYIIDIYMPTFFNLTFKEKLITIFHELYHISPKFDGNLRLFSGKKYKHGPSIERYDKYMDYLVSRYLEKLPTAVEFLKNSSEELTTKFKKFKIPRCLKSEPQIFRIIWS